MKTVTLTADQLATLVELGQQRDMAVARFEGAARMLIPTGAQPHQLNTKTKTLIYFAAEDTDVADPE
jgi:hypothetical protein